MLVQYLYINMNLEGSDMKKIKWITLAAALILALGCTTLLASAHGRRYNVQSTQSSTASVCAYCEDGSHCFTDADGDGICDNCPAAQTTTSSRGQGNAWHHTAHAGHGHQTGHHWGGHHGC